MNAFKTLSAFQLTLIGVFGACAILAMLAFSLGWFSSKKDDANVLEGTVTVWGTLPQDEFNTFARAAFPDNNKLAINYTEKTPDAIDSSLAEAVAVGSGPDMIVMPEDRLLRHILKIQPLTIPVRTIDTGYIAQSDMYVRSDGVYGLPLVVDPLVLYWNRSIFSAAGIATPPKYWEEFFNLIPALTRFSDPVTKSISQSAIALGEYSNITDAKEILSALLLQAGDHILSVDPTTGTLTVNLGGTLNGASQTESPLASVLRFYLQFANQDNAAYTWSGNLPNSQDMFTSGQLAMYIGLASEAPELARKNPHLDFDVAMLPQLQKATVSSTFGRMYGISVLKGKATALVVNVATGLSFSGATGDLANALSMAPTQRTLVAAPPASNVFAPVFYRSALITDGWFDPSPAQTSSIFSQMINDAVSSTQGISNSALSARGRMQQLIRSLGT